MNDLLRHVRAGEPISANQYNLLVDLVKGVGSGTHSFVDRTGLHARRPLVELFGAAHVVVREVYGSVETPSPFVFVQKVGWTGQSDWWQAEGDAFLALVKPGLFSHHYAVYVWRGDTLDKRRTRFLLANLVDGYWRLTFEHDFIPKPLPAGVRYTDCLPLDRAGGISV